MKKSRTFVGVLYQKDEIFQKYPSKERNFWSETLCYRKKFSVSRRNILWQEEISCHRKKFAVSVKKNFLSQEEISNHWMKFYVREKEFPVTGKIFCNRKHFLSQETISCHRKQFPVTIRNLLSQENFSCLGKKFFTSNIFLVRQSQYFFLWNNMYFLYVRGFAPPLAISIHLLCTNSIIHVTRTLFLVRENSFLMKFGSS